MTRRTTIALLTAAALVAVGCGANPGADQPAPAVETTPQADPSSDPGAGTPGTFCATSRLGKTFTKDAVVYVCKGPKPYKWRRADG